MVPANPNHSTIQPKKYGFGEGLNSPLNTGALLSPQLRWCTLVLGTCAGEGHTFLSSIIEYQVLFEEGFILPHPKLVLRTHVQGNCAC